jgi:RNA polymerase sigma factor (sigma-70 family)
MEQALAMPFAGGREATRQMFEELYRSSRDDLYAYVATLLGDRASAEDVTATAFERAFRKRSTFQARRGSPRAWLFGIARNAALDELRRRRHLAPLEWEAEGEAGSKPDDEADLALRRTAIQSALTELTPRERDLIALKFHGGLSNGEIARVLATSETNVGTLLHRTIGKLREACHAKP